MKAQESAGQTAAGHILAKIVEIVLSGDLDNIQTVETPPNVTTTVTVQSRAEKRLSLYSAALDTVTRYMAVEPVDPKRNTEGENPFKHMHPTRS